MSFVSLAVAGGGALVGAGVGGLKAKLAADKEKRDIALAANTQRYSPWTGLQANAIQHADPVGDILTGATSGAMQGQAIARAAPAAPGAPASPVDADVVGGGFGAKPSPWNLGVDYKTQLSRLGGGQ